MRVMLTVHSRLLVVLLTATQAAQPLCSSFLITSLKASCMRSAAMENIMALARGLPTAASCCTLAMVLFTPTVWCCMFRRAETSSFFSRTLVSMLSATLRSARDLPAMLRALEPLLFRLTPDLTLWWSLKRV